MSATENPEPFHLEKHNLKSHPKRKLQGEWLLDEADDLFSEEIEELLAAPIEPQNTDIDDDVWYGSIQTSGYSIIVQNEKGEIEIVKREDYNGK